MLKTSHNAIFTVIFRNTQSKSHMLSLTGCVWEFRNNALWDTHYHVILIVISINLNRWIDEYQQIKSAKIMEGSYRRGLNWESVRILPNLLFSPGPFTKGVGENQDGSLHDWHGEPIVDDWAHTISLDAVFYMCVYAYWHIYHNLSISECFIAYCQQYPKKH